MTHVNTFVHAVFPSSSVGKVAACSPDVTGVVYCLFFPPVLPTLFRLY